MATGLTSPHKEALQTDKEKSINEVRGWKWLVLWLLASLVRVWGRTLRMQADAETYAKLTSSDHPVAIVLWHNRLFLSAEIFRRYRSRRRVYGLVSASKDGAWLAAFYRLIGLIPVRGSSSNYGREAAQLLIGKLQEGYDIGITPDGPRGPLYVVEPGVVVVTRRTNAAMVLIGAEFTRAKRLGSWDRFYIPWPFSRIKMRCVILPAKTSDGLKLTADEVRAGLVAINPDPAVS